MHSEVFTGNIYSARYFLGDILWGGDLLGKYSAEEYSPTKYFPVPRPKCVF
jgi:hypothetical protein